MERDFGHNKSNKFKEIIVTPVKEVHLCEVGYNLAINKFQENVMIPFSAALTTTLASLAIELNTLVSFFWSWQLT